MDSGLDARGRDGGNPAAPDSQTRNHPQGEHAPQPHERNLERVLWPAFESGKIRPVIQKILPVQQAEEAHELLRAGRGIGKIVLTVGKA